MLCCLVHLVRQKIQQNHLLSTSTKSQSQVSETQRSWTDVLAVGWISLSLVPLVGLGRPFARQEISFLGLQGLSKCLSLLPLHLPLECAGRHLAQGLLCAFSRSFLNPVKTPFKKLSTDGTETDQHVQQWRKINSTMVINTTQLS